MESINLQQLFLTKDQKYIFGWKKFTDNIKSENRSRAIPDWENVPEIENSSQHGKKNPKTQNKDLEKSIAKKNHSYSYVTKARKISTAEKIPTAVQIPTVMKGH